MSSGDAEAVNFQFKRLREDMQHRLVCLSMTCSGPNRDGKTVPPIVDAGDALKLCRGLDFDVHDN